MSTITKLLPLVLLFAFVGGFVWIGYQMYIFSLQLADRGQKKMEKHNISMKDGGLKVGVKQRSAEEVAAKQQSALVDMWNYSSWPAYKSRFWNKEAQAAPASDGKPSTSRQSASSSIKPAVSRTTSSSSAVKPTASRTNSSR